MDITLKQNEPWDGLVIKQGDTFRLPITWIDDPTGYTGLFQIRQKIEDDTYVIELSTEDGGILIEDGKIYLLISAAATRALEAMKNAVYELKMISPTGDVTTILFGKCTITREVARP